MKHVIIIATLLVSLLTNAQTNYEKGMQKAFELWRNNNPVEASNTFERIANAEPDNWLPAYYAAQINIINSFGLRDEEKLTAQLKKAQNLINDAKAISKNNPEIMVLQALLHTAWVAFDGGTYGMTLSDKVIELYTKATQIAPENPRVVYCKAEWNMNSAKYFGQDTEPFCKDIERALELFANFKPETPFHPNWGKERVVQILETCGK
jgi:tetratricopeptide (TPR) repeat protein